MHIKVIKQSAEGAMTVGLYTAASYEDAVHAAFPIGGKVVRVSRTAKTNRWQVTMRTVGNREFGVAVWCRIATPDDVLRYGAPVVV